MLLHPDASFAILASGIAACLWELVQPGRIVPGVLGLGAIAVGAYWLYRNHPIPIGLVCITVSLLVPVVGVFLRRPLVSGTVASASMTIGFVLLFSGPLRISPILALPVCTVLSFAAAWLLNGASVAYLQKK